MLRTQELTSRSQFFAKIIRARSPNWTLKVNFCKNIGPEFGDAPGFFSLETSTTFLGSPIVRICPRLLGFACVCLRVLPFPALCGLLKFVGIRECQFVSQCFRSHFWCDGFPLESRFKALKQNCLHSAKLRTNSPKFANNRIMKQAFLKH